MSEERLDLGALFAAAASELDGRPRRRAEPKPAQFDPASGWVADEDFVGDERDRPETREDQDRRRLIYSRQVCVRLSPGQFGELGSAANLYGVAPSTMARILLRRGARAILEHHRRYDLEQDGAD
jgi:hypothetical protein